MGKDLFSEQAGSYAAYRPRYPAELFGYLLQFVENRSVAWDCATGNGQAALALAPHFEKVFATDISPQQLALAPGSDKVEYLCCAAEQTPFPDTCFDLVTIAQAYHWLNFKAFEREVVRVSRPGAVIAAWGYDLISTDDENVNALIRRFYRDVAGPYWDPERKFVEENYRTVPFNFHPLPGKDFVIHGEWRREDLLGYLQSWSAIVHFMSEKLYNPVNLFLDELVPFWKTGELKQVCFPLFLKLGKVLK